MLDPGRLVDFHIHSSASDGTYTPFRLAEKAAGCGLGILALCDHDTLDGLDSFMEAAFRFSLFGIPAVEVSSELDGLRLHIVGLGLRKERRAGLQSFLDDVRSKRDERNILMVEKLCSLGLSITMDDVREEAGGEIVARPHFARALVRNGHAVHMQHAFDCFIANDRPGYVPKVKPAPSEVVGAIQSVGGLAIVAHPNSLHEGDRREFLARLDRLVELGIDGIEAFHPDTEPDLSALVVGYAVKNRLLVSGGSDFHGDNKQAGRNQLGKVAHGRRLCARDVQGLIARLGQMGFLSTDSPEST